MLQNISPERTTVSETIFINDLAKVRALDPNSIDSECWQIYYQDLSLAAEKIRALIREK